MEWPTTAVDITPDWLSAALAPRHPGVDAAAGAIEDLAALHLRFEDPARREAEAPWVQVSKPTATYAATMLREGIDHHRERLTDAFVEIAEVYFDHHDELQRLWHEGPP